MPWDSTELHCADIQQQGLIDQQLIAGSNGNEAIFQPQWSPDNKLYYVSDRDNWWNIYSAENGIVLQMPAEFATPLWQFGMSTYDFIDSNTIACLWTEQGIWHCGYIDITKAKLHHVPCPYFLCKPPVAIKIVCIWLPVRPISPMRLLLFVNRDQSSRFIPFSSSD